MTRICLRLYNSRSDSVNVLKFYTQCFFLLVYNWFHIYVLIFYSPVIVLISPSYNSFFLWLHASNKLKLQSNSFKEAIRLYTVSLHRWSVKHKVFLQVLECVPNFLIGSNWLVLWSRCFPFYNQNKLMLQLK